MSCFIIICPASFSSGVQVASLTLPYPAHPSKRDTGAQSDSSIPRSSLKAGYRCLQPLFHTPLIHQSGVQVPSLTLPYPAHSSKRGTCAQSDSSIPRSSLKAGYRCPVRLFHTPFLHQSGVQVTATALLYPAPPSIRGTVDHSDSSIPRSSINPGYS